MEEMISGRDMIEYFARVERELSEMMKVERD